MNKLTGIAATLDRELELGLNGDARWFRADVSRGLEPQPGLASVDRAQGIIRGYAVITKGPALGHNMQVDDKTLAQVVQLGNQSQHGIKSRFDHPNASNTSMGTFLGRTKNFRLAGDRVIGDLHLSESAKEAPQGDLYSYVLGLAERDPQAFGASIVFEGKSEVSLNPDGSPSLTPQGKAAPSLARVEKLLASDIVDEPAANAGGLFSAGEGLASKITAFLNRWATHDLLPQLQALTGTHKEDPMVDVTAEVGAVELAAATSAGMKAERARVSGIFAAMLPGQEQFAKDLIEAGATLDEASRAFKVRKLTEIQVEAPATAGGAVDIATAPKVDLSTLPLEDRCKAEWETNVGSVRDEFETLSQYLAFAKAEARGVVKMLKK